jgi:hypothetical protein
MVLVATGISGFAGAAGPGAAGAAGAGGAGFGVAGGGCWARAAAYKVMNSANAAIDAAPLLFMNADMNEFLLN